MSELSEHAHVNTMSALKSKKRTSDMVSKPIPNTTCNISKGFLVNSINKPEFAEVTLKDSMA